MIKAKLLNKPAAQSGEVNAVCLLNGACIWDYEPCWTDDPCPNYVNPCTTDCGGSGGVNRMPL